MRARDGCRKLVHLRDADGLTISHTADRAGPARASRTLSHASGVTNMRSGYRVVDVDTHVTPSVEVLLRYADPALRARADELLAAHPWGSALRDSRHAA